MEIYILRHGIAEDAQAGQPDSERALTPDGRKKLRTVLRVAANAGVAPSLILTSPYKRALQTAQIAAEILDYKGELLRTKSLEPISAPKTVWDEIRVHKDEARILLAGHEPLFSRLTAYLLGSPNLQVDFKKGAIACIELERFPAEPHGVLRWLLTSKLASAG
ncbi:MAG TPA: phosphohistidine phosphatase SixA [Bryobacteraceae bacterium]|jgi:phosphohistidine phosphatase|nr:phosphohistidine phosphatase SixA [Bryobacteraceae bacterium]